MRMRRCWACNRRRPMKRLNWADGEEAVCHDGVAASCRRAMHRDDARITRMILGDHDESERGKWRRILARHKRKAEIGRGARTA